MTLPALNIQLLEGLFAPNTWRAYKGDWDSWRWWCVGNRACPMPAEPRAIAAWFIEESERGVSVATLRRRRAALATIHRRWFESQGDDGADMPTSHRIVGDALKAAGRNGEFPKRARPLLLPELLAILGTNSQLPRGIPHASTPTNSFCRGILSELRNRALILVGLAGAFRGSELVGIDLEHIEWAREGVLIEIPRSKTGRRRVDIQYGSSVDTCPVNAFRAWLEAFSPKDGPVFVSINKKGVAGPQRLSARAVSRILRKVAQKAGIEGWEEYSSHSLRRGFMTGGAAGGATVPELTAISGQTFKTAQGYIDAVPFRSDAARKYGL